MAALDSAITGFASTAGVTAPHLSLLIRSILCGLFLLWAAWNIYGHMQLVQDQHLDLYDLPMSILRILLLCAWIILLIFVN
jgi:integrating conjugative element protein (TIGR03758 family)